MVVGFMLLANIMYILQRAAINYAYGYRGTGTNMGNPFFEIVADYPQIEKYYGLLVGLVYTVPFALTGLVAGNISERANRKIFLGTAIILSSITFGVAGAVNSFAVFALMRAL